MHPVHFHRSRVPQQLSKHTPHLKSCAHVLIPYRKSGGLSARRRIREILAAISIFSVFRDIVREKCVEMRYTPPFLRRFCALGRSLHIFENAARAIGERHYCALAHNRATTGKHHTRAYELNGRVHTRGRRARREKKKKRKDTLFSRMGKRGFDRSRGKCVSGISVIRQLLRSITTVSYCVDYNFNIFVYLYLCFVLLVIL